MSMQGLVKFSWWAEAIHQPSKHLFHLWELDLTQPNPCCTVLVDPAGRQGSGRGLEPRVGTGKYSQQCVTNTIFRPKYEYKFIRVNIFWQIQIQVYSSGYFLANTNTNTFWSHFLDKNKYKYIHACQKWANMSRNTIIRTDICKYKYYHTQKIYMFMDKKKLQKLSNNSNICHNLQCIVLGI